MTTQSHLELYKSLFKGRDDVFAIRWEKGIKSGYTPAHQFDPYQYRLHQVKGGTFQNFTDKTLQPLSDQQLLKHLNGQQLIGLYPLLTDNTSWFIAADFDKENWIEQCRLFLKVCGEYQIPAYLERSRSGNGGHVWIFFDEPYAALSSRRILITLLEQCGIFSIFDKSSSFDRLFPNQDYLTKKGFGNLIALPLHKAGLEKGNSCFIDPITLTPFDDQWAFLKTICRISIQQLETLYRQCSPDQQYDTGLFQKIASVPGKLSIRLDHEIHLERSGITPSLISFLKEELNFANSEYQAKRKNNSTTWGTQRFFKFLEETEKEIRIPRGFIGKLLRFCKQNQIEYLLEDERGKAEAVSFKGSIQLKDHQVIATDAASRKDFGVIVAPPGSGKTVVSLAIIKEKQQPALIIVHRKQLADQWIERIESFLGIPAKEIGKIGQGKTKIGKQITVATIQSLEKAIQALDSHLLLHAFGTIIIDECHHVPAETFRNTISKFNSFYLYGLTATPFRKYNDGKLIFIHLGEIISEIKAEDLPNAAGAQINIRNTDLYVPFNIKTDQFETLSKILVHDSARNKLILDDVVAELNRNKKSVIITERKEHIDSLYQYLKQSYDTVTLSGDDPEKIKKTKWDTIQKGDFQVLVTTGQYFGEGTDLQNIECLFLVYPFSFEGKLVQYIGRVQRSEVAPSIYDYRDHKIAYLDNLFKKRNAYYNKLNKAGLLKAADESEAVNFRLEERIQIPVEQLEFRFGSIAFKYQFEELNVQVEFETENIHVRPEFGVLKPYFLRFLKSETVRVDIKATFQDNRIVFKSAYSSDLDKINKEVIESMRFRFISREILKSIPEGPGNLLDINQVQGTVEKDQQLFQSEEELLESVLALRNAKHYRHLRYLSQKHDRAILKIRFVLEPFSFVFLLTGSYQYHIVWETLDTEEATYIWHIDKNKRELRTKIMQVDQALGIIRSKGRQAYLETNPENFVRVVHDYSQDTKAFISWKDALEEKLY